MVLDLVGAASTVNLAIASATRGTEIVVVGLYGGELTVSVPFFPLRPLAIRGSYVGNLAELRELVGLARDGKVAGQVTRRPLDEVTEALGHYGPGRWWAGWCWCHREGPHNLSCPHFGPMAMIGRASRLDRYRGYRRQSGARPRAPSDLKPGWALGFPGTIGYADPH